MKRFVAPLCLMLAVAAPAAPPDRKGDAVVIRAGKIFTAAGPTVENGAVLVVDGKIRAVGASIEAPAGARVLDSGAEAFITPGFVDAASRLGLESGMNEASSEVTPRLRPTDGWDPWSEELRGALSNGLTTIGLTPGTQAVIGGLQAVVKTAGADRHARILREDAAIVAAMGEDPSAGNFPPRGGPPLNFYARRPTTRMGVVWLVRKAFSDASEAGAAETGSDEALLKRALEKRIPVHVVARRDHDIRSAFRLADEFGFSVVLEEATEGYKLAPEIARRNVPAIVGPLVPTPQGSAAREDSEVSWNLAGLLAKAGVKVALRAGPGASSEDGPAWQAALAERFGMPREQALLAITRTPAEILGVADRVGSLEAGKDADLVVWSGDPLLPASRIEWVFVDGALAFGAR